MTRIIRSDERPRAVGSAEMLDPAQHRPDDGRYTHWCPLPRVPKKENMESMKFNLTAFTNPASLMEVNALLDEVLSMVDELGDRLACVGKALEGAERAHCEAATVCFARVGRQMREGQR